LSSEKHYWGLHSPDHPQLGCPCNGCERARSAAEIRNLKNQLLREREVMDDNTAEAIEMGDLLADVIDAAQDLYEAYTQEDQIKDGWKSDPVLDPRLAALFQKVEALLAKEETP
jgi:hypothetical protein